MDISPYAQNIESLRMRAGLTQTELAGTLGFTQSKLSLYEAGKRRPEPRRYRRIVEYLEAVISGDEARAQAIARGEAA